MRAPPESFSPITGAPLRIAKSIILQIFSALVSESDPPNTVKSCANTYTNRPSIRPNPVTNPSPVGRISSEPKSTERCRTNLSSSSNVPSSSNKSIRSRAESFPALCSRSLRSAPPPASASADILRNCSTRSAFAEDCHVTLVFSAKRSSVGWFILWRKNQHGQVRCQPYRAQQQHDSQHYFCSDRSGSFHRRFNRRHIQRCTHQDCHGAQGHRHNHDRR